MYKGLVHNAHELILTTDIILSALLIKRVLKR